MKRNSFFAGLAIVVGFSFVQAGCGPSGPAPLSGEIAKTNIAFTENRNNALWIIKADGSGLRKLNSDVRSTVRFSPDGRLLSFKVSNDVHLITDLDGNVIYTFPGCYDSDDFTWAPDGKAIVFGCYLGGIERYDLGGGDPVELVKIIDSTYDHEPVISPDGSRIIYTHNEYGVQYTTYMIDPDGGNKRTLEKGVSAHDARNCMVWVDNTHVIFTPLDGTIHFLNVDTLVDTVTNTFTPDSFNAIRLNNSMTWIAIYGVMYIGLSSATGLPSGTIAVKEAPGSWGFIGSKAFAWSPDGAYYVVSGENVDSDDAGKTIIRIFSATGTEYRFLKYGDLPDAQQPLFNGDVMGVDWATAPS